MYKRFRKKKIILPLLVFLSGMSILGLTTYHMIKEQQKHDRTLADLNAMIYAERMNRGRNSCDRHIKADFDQ